MSTIPIVEDNEKSVKSMCDILRQSSR